MLHNTRSAAVAENADHQAPSDTEVTVIRHYINQTVVVAVNIFIIKLYKITADKN